MNRRATDPSARPPSAARRFLLVFAAYLGTAWVVFGGAWIDTVPVQQAYYRGLALISGVLARVAGFEVVVEGTDVIGYEMLTSVVRGCGAIDAGFLFIAAVLAFPVPWKSRMKALLIGVPSLLFVNVLRVTSLVILGETAPEHVDFIHVDVWQVLLILLVTFGWAVWARSAMRPSPTAETSPR